MSGRRATLLHAWVNGGRCCAVVAERPSGLRRVRSGAEALMAGWGLGVVAGRGGAATVQWRRWQRRATLPWPKQRSRVRGERRERKKEREVNMLTRDFLQIFHGNSKKFEHESSSKFKFLQLSFQAKIHLSNDLNVILNFQKLGFKLFVISCGVIIILIMMSTRLL